MPRRFLAASCNSAYKPDVEAVGLRAAAASAEDLKDTTDALLALCRDGPTSGAKAAPRAIVAVEGRTAATEHLGSLAEELTSRLTKSGAAVDPKLPFTLAALSSIGRLLPEVCAQ
jgi:hypothetical protein